MLWLGLTIAQFTLVNYWWYDVCNVFPLWILCTMHCIIMLPMHCMLMLWVWDFMAFVAASCETDTSFSVVQEVFNTVAIWNIIYCMKVNGFQSQTLTSLTFPFTLSTTAFVSLISIVLFRASCATVYYSGYHSNLLAARIQIFAYWTQGRVPYCIWFSFSCLLWNSGILWAYIQSWDPHMSGIRILDN
jgi:hypothetical protein